MRTRIKEIHVKVHLWRQKKLPDHIATPIAQKPNLHRLLFSPH